MTHKFGPCFYQIAGEIVNEGKSTDEWAEIESSDMFQNEMYLGGFDATENEFCFSAYVDGKEYWFQLPLEKIIDVNNRVLNEVEVRPADK